MIIKLTEVLDGDAERVLYVNVDRIEIMWTDTDRELTYMLTASENIHWVRETPEQILDM